jgi:hemoglobin
MGLYDKIGGQPAIEQTVDSTLNHFFAGTDMVKQRNHLVAFLSQIFDGPKQYTGRPMEKTHTGMSLQQQHFDAIAKHLSASMAASGVSADDTTAALASVSALKASILNK